jgi:putative transposase
MVKNPCLAKSINDASWYLFRVWIEYFAKVFEKVTVAVIPSKQAKNARVAVKL